MAKFIICSALDENLVLDIADGSTKQGAKLIVYPKHGGPNQQFTIDANGFIKCVKSGFVLDVEGGVRNGAKIIQFQAHGGANQKWKFHTDGTIRLAGQDLVLDVTQSSTKPGTNVIAFSYHGGNNQKWKMMTV